MHYRHISIALATILAPLAASGALDLTARYADILADGVPVHSLYLQDGPQKVFLRTPLHWDAKNEAGALCLTAGNNVTGRVDIRSSAVKLPAQPDDKWVKSMTPALLKSLPSGAQDATVLESKLNPFPINGWDTFEFKMSYSIAGVKYLRSVCFVTLRSKESLEVLAGGTENEWGPAHTAAFALLSTWQEPPVKVMNRMLQ